MTFTLGVKLPNGYGGATNHPTFGSWLEKGGRRVLVASAEATCADCAVKLATVPATAGSV